MQRRLTTHVEGKYVLVLMMFDGHTVLFSGLMTEVKSLPSV
jgi:hypothetical protein